MATISLAKIPLLSLRVNPKLSWPKNLTDIKRKAQLCVEYVYKLSSALKTIVYVNKVSSIPLFQFQNYRKLVNH